MKTKVITNFSGALTRTKNGELNSGMAKFDTSFGYNPFSKPGQLTWFRAPVSANNSSIGLILASVSRIESGVIVTYAITNTGNLMKFSGSGFTATNLATLASGSPTFNYGGSIEFFNNNLYVGHDKGVTQMTTAGGGDNAVGTWDDTHFIPNIYRPMKVFNGALYIANGQSQSGASPNYSNNIAEIVVANPTSVVTYTKLSPALPVGSYIKDIDVTPDFSYLVISSSFNPSELIAPVNDGVNTGSAGSAIYKWNGTDLGATTGTTLPSFGITSFSSFGNNQMNFMYDTFGASLYDGNSKRVSIVNNKSPWPSAVASNGNFVTWTSPDVYYNLDTTTYSMMGSLYYYGNLDENSPNGLWRMFRQASATGGVIYQMPYNQFSTNRYLSTNTTPVVGEDSLGVHLFSFIDYSGSGGSTDNKFFSFDVAPSDTATGMIQGVFETQNELFSEKVQAKQIRVYCEPTVANNSFKIDMIGNNGKVMTNGTFTYAYAAGTDITLLQGSLERINFNPSPDFYALGIRITNLGTSNMVINKIEIDIEQSGK